MKFKLLLIITILFYSHSNAQVPCGPGMTGRGFYSFDQDNDGFTSFDIDYYIQNILRPELEASFQTSLSGYNMLFYNINNILSASPYTNINMNHETCYIEYHYSGSGPILDTGSGSCPIPLYTDVTLVAVNFDGDNDGDGILNINEDTNGNLNLMDDDIDNDGIINLLDPLNLSVDSFENSALKIFPNPTSNGIINVASDIQIKEVTLYDLRGKVLIHDYLSSNKIDVSKIASGTYLLKLKSDEKVFNQKIIIN